MAAAAATVTVPQLAALFAGDDLTVAHPTVALAHRICTVVQPATVSELKDAIYGEAWPVDEIPWAEREAMARGYTRWTQARGHE